ncbi:TMV resistance protein N-like isoform X1 [Prosopis cineraria]|uniref:TMV resistance protein N-like isoform X1 n=2 Tax=Prosopis cineraria TaxID=364024 RepID=UPI00240FDA64|nr:TMV resistance protein N-like isoform X1 [Prosopis cineraria]
MAAEISFSSSSSFSYEWTYDVFLNFRGEDTRFDFVRNLYNALNQKGIHTFMDDEGLRRGEKITPSLVKAIRESRIAIAIFSRNYASSTFCLDELVQILECINSKGRLVLPIFYNVEPSEVRHQKENYAEAFAKHETRFENCDEAKVQKWRQALRDVANISGFVFRPGQEYECHFIERIVKDVSMRINRKPLHIADYPVGIESRVQQVQSLLDVNSNEGVQMVGIWGTGGIGKSTIARAVCNSIADLFEGFCFLANVRENSQKRGLAHLQEMLLSELMMDENITVRYVNKGIPIIKHKLHRKKVLIVLDDVDELEQLQAIAGGLDWFGSGSRIIITTRDKHLLARHGVDRIHEVESLNQEEALELLTWNAFKQNRAEQRYLDNLNNIILYASGLPLALEIIGSSLFGMGVEYWNSALENWRVTPNQKIQQVLKISYDALEEYEQEIFLDIACCFKGDTLEYVTSTLLASHGRCPKYAIKVLVDRCLIKICREDKLSLRPSDSIVTMHDLIQDMGKEIVRHQSPNDPGKRSRLWFTKDIVSVLEENEGTKKIEVINLHMLEDEEVDWDGMAFKKMSNLKMLIIRNAQFSTAPKYLPSSLRVLEWKGYPYSSLPCDFNPKQLVILRVPESRLTLNTPLKKFRSLTIMNLSRCELLREVPDLSEAPNLIELCLDGCINLTNVHASVGSLDKLKRLSAYYCKKLKNFPSIFLRSLEFLDLSECESLQTFPEILGTMENLREMNLTHSGIEILPLSIKNLIGLKELHLTRKLRHRGVKVDEISYSYLNSVSLNILLSQASHEVDGFKFIIRGDRPPKWFDHYALGDSVSFWFRRKQLPNVAVCFAVSATRDARHAPYIILIFNVQINGKSFDSLARFDQDIAFQNFYLMDLQNLIPMDELSNGVLQDEWNHVKVSCNMFSIACGIGMRPPPDDAVYTRWSGIYVHKQGSRMEDIRFTNPNVESFFAEFLEGSSSNPNTMEELIRHWTNLFVQGRSLDEFNDEFSNYGRMV